MERQWRSKRGRAVRYGAVLAAVALFVACPPNSLLTDLQQRVNDTQALGQPVRVPVFHPSAGTYSSDLRKFLYVANNGSNDVSAYTINTSTGALTLVGNYAAGTGPEGVAVEPTGKFLYVANYGSNNVSAYTINTITGTLTAVGSFAAGTGPAGIAIATVTSP
jgi:YVTN family beta-propeller protein